MAIGANPLLQAAGLIEAVDRRNQFLTIIFQQHRPMHQPDRAATALPPTLGSAHHFAAIEVDVVTAVAKGTVNFADGRIAAQLDQQITDRLAQAPIAGFDTPLVAFTARRGIDQGDIDRGAGLRHRLTTGFTQQYRPTRIGRDLARRLECRQPAQTARHDQRLVTGLPEQQSELLLPRANGCQ